MLKKEKLNNRRMHSFYVYLNPTKVGFILYSEVKVSVKLNFVFDLFR